MLRRTVFSRSSKTVVLNQNIKCIRLGGSRLVHSSSTQDIEIESKHEPSLENASRAENRHDSEMENQPKFSNILDSSEEDGKIDFNKLSEFIKNAYKDSESAKPVPVARAEQIEYFQELFSSYGSYRDSSSSRANRPKDKLRSQGINFVPDGFKTELFARTKYALEPTLEYLDSFKDSQELYNYTVSLFNKFQEQIALATKKAKKDDKQSQTIKTTNEEIFLNELFKSSNRHKWTESHEKYIKSIRNHSSMYPTDPLLNVLTVPIIFTRIISTLGFKFYNGQLALTLFDLLEKDPNLYIIAANQSAFNVALRLMWINNGILNLHPFHMWYTRMKFLGYPGDLTTLNILRIVISEYDNLSNGKSIFNRQGNKVYISDTNWRMKYFRAEYELIMARLKWHSRKNARMNTTKQNGSGTGHSFSPSWGWESIS